MVKTIIITALITFVLVEIIHILRRRSYNKEIAKILIDTVTFMFDCAKKGGYKSGVDYILKEKGDKYSIYFFGRIYSLLDTIGHKDEDFDSIKTAIEEYLKVAMAADIREYKAKKQRQQKMVDDLTK